MNIQNRITDKYKSTKVQKYKNKFLKTLMLLLFVIGINHTMLLAQDYPNDVYINPLNAAAYTLAFNQTTTSFGGNLILTNNVHFAIVEAELQFSENSRIIIETGSIFDGAGQQMLLTNYAGNGGDHWVGVEVLGNPNLGTSPVSNQGLLRIKHGSIENAIIGASNYDRTQSVVNAASSGGIIQFQHVTVTNCYQAIVLADYNYETQTYFNHCDFIWNTNTPFSEDQTFKPMIHNYGNTKIPFSFCEFTNTNEDIFYPNPHTDRAALLVENNGSINFANGLLDGFVYGIVISDGAPSSLISDTDFTCYRGIWIANVYNMDIHKCSFDHINLNYISSIAIYNGSIQVSDNQFGIYIEYSTGYTIEGNIINFPSDEEKETGIVVLQSGPFSNVLEQNTVNSCGGSGILCMRENRTSSGNQGLKLNCNYFSNNFGDISVSSQGGDQSKGIAKTQGINPLYGAATTAGNIFSTTGGIFTDNNSNNGYHILNVTGEVGHVDYYYLDPEDNLLEANGDITIHTSNLSGVVNYDNQNCLPQIPEDPNGLLDDANNHKNLRNEYQTQLDNIVDGGDTDALTLEVILTDYSEAVDLYYELMAKSPNLSEKVMIETILKETEISSALLTLILKSNPTAAKSTLIKQKLDERMIPLTEYQRYMIDQGANLVSQKENLESVISFHNSRYNNLLDQGVSKIIRADTLGYDANIVTTYISGNQRISDYYLLAEMYFQKDNIAAAESALSSISTDFELNDAQLEEYSDFADCFIIRKNAEINEGLTEDEAVSLEIIASRDLGRAKGLALSLLARHTDYVHYPYFEDLSNKVNATKTDYKPTNPASGIQLYPNPAMDYLTIQAGPADISLVEIVDMNGKTIIRQATSKASEPILDLRQLISGHYQVIIHLSSEEKIVKKLEILK